MWCRRAEKWVNGLVSTECFRISVQMIIIAAILKEGSRETSRSICHSSYSMSHNDYSLYFASLVLQLISNRAEEVCARRWGATVMSQKQIRESFRCPASLSTPCSFTFLLFCFSRPPSKNNYRWLGGGEGNDLSRRSDAKLSVCQVADVVSCYLTVDS